MDTNVLDWLEVTAAACPDKPAFLDEDGAVTFADVRREARIIGTAAARLRAGRNAPTAVMTADMLYRCNLDMFKCTKKNVPPSGNVKISRQIQTDSFSRAIGDGAPVTLSPSFTSTSVPKGRYTSTREPNLINPHCVFCPATSPTRA